ncbi:hypothetical protein RND81_03G057800 [Saponaria officinalis]|uniref:Uncharacterized protein n=1 Tax=Saponaria officinalis TaxID=3572 RepID=A0AAW1LYE5_SAPOF
MIPPKTEPCMDSDQKISSIIDEAGTSFILGSTAGFVYHFLKGYKTRYKSRTFTNRLRAAVIHVSSVGGVGVKWTLLLYVVNNGLARLRNRSDPINSFCVGDVTAAAATAHHGSTFVVGAGVCIGVIMATVEVLSKEIHKLEERLDWLPTGPLGCIIDKFASIELTHLARLNASINKATSP